MATLGGPTTTGGRTTDTADPGQHTEEDSTGDELTKICVFDDNEFISGQSTVFAVKSPLFWYVFYMSIGAFVNLFLRCV